jgi:hypothetical protein
MDSIQRGVEAEQLLANPLLKEAFAGVKAALVASLEDVPIGDIDTHHQIALSLQALKTVRRYLENWVQGGRLEAERATSTANWQKFMKRSGVKT